MGVMVSQITSISIVDSTIYSGTDKNKNHQSTASLAFVSVIHQPVTRKFPSQRVSNAENVSIWWCHHVQIKTNQIDIVW